MTTRFRFHPEPVKPAPLQPVSMPSVTPLLGVLIVLLVSYLASLPPQKSLDVIVPAQETRLFPSTAIYDPLYLEISPDGSVAINRTPIPLDQLRTRLRDIMANRSRKEVYVIAAPTLRYGDVARVVDALKGGGVRQIVMMPAPRQ